MSDKLELLSLDAQQLRDWVTQDLGESKFRADQIAQWLSKGAEIDEMTNLSAALRGRMKEVAVALSLIHI